jgi:deazaflavin-dependent oxidoreductase (nitroreductase family)
MRGAIKGVAVVLLLVVVAAAGILLHDMTNLFGRSMSADQPTSSPLAERLARVADHSTLQLTHYGRKTGTPYTVTIWFAVDGETVYLPTADRRRQWGRNVRRNPRVALDIGDEHFEGTVTPLTDPPEMLKLYDLLRAKYLVIRLMSLAGGLAGIDPHEDGLDLGEGGFFRVDLNATPDGAKP